jgi:hypothetical protein
MIIKRPMDAIPITVPRFNFTEFEPSGGNRVHWAAVAIGSGALSGERRRGTPAVLADKTEGALLEWATLKLAGIFVDWLEWGMLGESVRVAMTTLVVRVSLTVTKWVSVCDGRGMVIVGRMETRVTWGSVSSMFDLVLVRPKFRISCELCSIDYVNAVKHSLKKIVLREGLTGSSPARSPGLQNQRQDWHHGWLQYIIHHLSNRWKFVTHW